MASLNSLAATGFAHELPVAVIGVSRDLVSRLLEVGRQSPEHGGIDEAIKFTIDVGEGLILSESAYPRCRLIGVLGGLDGKILPRNLPNHASYIAVRMIIMS
jgi:hypothetical protein